MRLRGGVRAVLAALLALLLTAPLLPEAAFADDECMLPSVLSDVGAGPQWIEITGCQMPAELQNPDFVPDSAVSDGDSVFLLESSTGRVAQVKRATTAGVLNVRPNSATKIEFVAMPAIPIPTGSSLGGGQIMLGPRAFFAVLHVAWNDIPDASKDPSLDAGDCADSPCPTLFRADHIPSVVRGEWRALKPIGGIDSRVVGAQIQNNTLFTLRVEGAALGVGWQPLGAASTSRLPSAGPTVLVGADTGSYGFAMTRNAAIVSDGTYSHTVPIVKGSPREPKAPVALCVATRPAPQCGPRDTANLLVHANYLYDVGGNTTGPLIERSRYDTQGQLGSWEQFLDPSKQTAPLADDPITAATFSRGFLWLFRDSGLFGAPVIHVMRVSDAAAGQARIAWHVDTRPRVVELGQAYELPVTWDYIGPMELGNLSALVAATPAQTQDVIRAGATRPAPFAWLESTGGLEDTIAIPGLLPTPTGPGTPLSLCIKIPLTTRRTDFQATVLVRSGKQGIGPALRLTFKVANKKLRPTQPPNPTGSCTV